MKNTTKSRENVVCRRPKVNCRRVCTGCPLGAFLNGDKYSRESY